VNREKLKPRAEYRLRQSERAGQSANLTEKFSELKSLTVEFGYFSPEGITRNRHIKYVVNPAHAKSVFLLDCQNNDCVGGDFDLSETLAKAIGTHQTSVAGEMRCQGWLDQSAIDRVHCHNIVRYKLSLEFDKEIATKAPPSTAEKTQAG
jgi:hypothetical protein